MTSCLHRDGFQELWSAPFPCVTTCLRSTTGRLEQSLSPWADGHGLGRALVALHQLLDNAHGNTLLWTSSWSSSVLEEGFMPSLLSLYEMLHKKFWNSEIRKRIFQINVLKSPINLAIAGVQSEIKILLHIFQNIPDIHTWSLQAKVYISLIIICSKTNIYLRFDTHLYKVKLLLGMMHISVLLFVSSNDVFLVSIKSKIHDCNSTVPMQFVKFNSHSP